MAVWRFEIYETEVRCGGKKRLKLTRKGCNEPFKGRYWCPKRHWFRNAPCPFENLTECDNYRKMCGCL
jgi:hypothetical protein